MLDGIVDYISDPTGMGAYRSGLKKQEDAQRAELGAMRGRMEGVADGYTESGKQISSLYSPLSALAGTGANMLQGDFTTATPNYQFEGTVEDYLDPSIDYQVDQATRGIESGAGARGSLLSGATLKAVADRAQQIGQTGYENARGAMERDRAFGANQAQTDFQNRAANNAMRFGQAQNLVNAGAQGLQGQAAGLQFGQQGAGSTLANAYGQMVDPTAGLGDIRKGEMHGATTAGIANYLSDLSESAVGSLTGQF